MLLLHRLIEQFPNAKRQTLKEMVQNRRVLINDLAATKLKQPVEAGDVVRVLSQGAVVAAAASLPFRVVFEDADILVIDKPAGLLTSTVPNETRTTAIALVQNYLADREPNTIAGLIHRLDRDASGLLVFSKNDPAYQSLKMQFFNHTVNRIYTAVVSPIPVPTSGRIESNLVEWADGSVRSSRMKNKGQAAATDYAVMRQGNDLAVLKVTLQTGRKHQIRAHLSERGWPVVGDTVYGGVRDAGGLMLAATDLELEHPATGRRVPFRIEPPARMAHLIARTEPIKTV